MTNLLPKFEKNRVRLEYRARILTIAGIVSAVLIFSTIIPLILSYFTISYNVGFINSIADNLSASKSFLEMNSLIKTTKDTNRKISLLTESMGKTNREGLTSSFSSIFKIANNLKNNKNIGIKINQLSYEQTQKKGATSQVLSSATTTSGTTVPESGMHKITVRGTARSREIFLSFLRMLESEKNFLSIDSPVSNLVESENFNFHIVITLRDNRVI